MAVQMIVGNGNGYPFGAFVPFTTLTSNIVQNWGYAEVWSGDFSAPTQQNALFACAFVLLVIILILNLLLLLVNKRQAGDRFFTRRFSGGGGGEVSFKQTGVMQNALFVLSAIVANLLAFVPLAILGFVFVKGIPNLNFHFLFGESSNAQITLLPALVSTFMLIALSLAIALPTGICGAIYLSEYAKDNLFVKIVRLFIDTLSGIPSIVFGIFGYVFFVRALGFGYSLAAGGITLALMVLPTIICSVEQSLSEVPISMREASFALGAGKMRTIFKVVVPRALSGILTATILSIGRIVAESAALIFTVGTAATFVPVSYGEGCASLAVLIWQFMSNGLQVNQAYATAAVLVTIVAILNLAVSATQKLFKGERA
jgi:phosphate transport system permease protein